MTGDEAVLAVIDALEASEVPYMLVGSLSSNYYGIPRATRDADFVVQLSGNSIRDIVQRLGPAFQLDPQISFELVTGTSRYRIHLVDDEFEIEFFLLSEDPHDKERFARRCEVLLLGRRTFLPTAEDVIVTKLRWAMDAVRLKDREDLFNVIAVRGDRIDWDYVYRWADRHGTRQLLDEIRASIPPI